MITNEKAIELLMALQNPGAWESQLTVEAYEALDKAIEAIGEIHPLDYNAQAIKARIERLPSSEITLEQVKAYCEPRCLTVVTSELVQHWKNILSEEPLTDIEQRIFLAAMRKEEEVCRKADKEIDGDINLTHVCKEIERKVKGALWT